MAKTQQDVVIYNEKSFSTAQSQFEKDLKKQQRDGWRLVSVTPTKKRTFGRIVQLTAIYERDVADDGGTSAATRAQEKAQEAAIIAENKAKAKAERQAKFQEAQRIAREREQAYQASLSPEQLQQYLKHKRRKNLIIAAIIFGVLALCFAMVANNPAMQASINADLTPVPTDTPAPPTPTPKPATPTPTPKPKVWTTTHSFSGSNQKKTEVFTVPDTWKIKYTCNGMGDGFSSNFALTVYGSDGSYIDLAANLICKDGQTTADETLEYQGGSVYLDIAADGPWTIDVQEMK